MTLFKSLKFILKTYRSPSSLDVIIPEILLQKDVIGGLSLLNFKDLETCLNLRK